MEFLKHNYINGLLKESKNSIYQQFNLPDEFTDFNIINSFIVDKSLFKNNTNLLITTPYNSIGGFSEKIFLASIIIPTLNCLCKNIEEPICFGIGEMVINKKDGRISTIKSINDSQVSILPLGTTSRIKVEIKDYENYIHLSPTFEDKLEDFKHNHNKRTTFEKKRFQELKIYESIASLFHKKKIQIPSKNKSKIILVGFKSEILTYIPDFIPFNYMNKKGVIEYFSPFDPLLIVVNDFETVKEYFIEKEIPIDTIIFIGDNKFGQSISSISKNYRQKKFNRCIFVGTEHIENGENFPVLKWNWTLAELKFLAGKSYQNLSSETIDSPWLSSEVLNFTKYIDKIQNSYDNIISLKKLFKFIRLVYTITAIQNKKRIIERANKILEDFLVEAKDIFEDEYYKIDVSYREELEQLTIIFQNIINHIKNSNLKEFWFKTIVDIDFIVVPKSIKNILEKEITESLKPKIKPKGINVNLQNLAEKFNDPKPIVISEYMGLKETKVITVSDFLKKDKDQKTYLFLSIYGNGMYADDLLKKILASNQKVKILCYREEAKILQVYLQNFREQEELQLNSTDRITISGLTYPKSHNIGTENIDEWINFLIDFDEQRLFRRDEQKYEIVFEGDFKTTQRESKSVLVEGYEEIYKEIRDLKKGDNVRIYENPDKEILHDIIKMTDEKELFSRVDYFSLLWKNALNGYYLSKGYSYNLENLFEELKENGLSVDINRLENWLKPENKTKFPMKKRDLLAIIKTVNHPELIKNKQNIFEIKTEYSGKIIKSGVEFSEEVNTYILTKEKGKMLSWLSDKHICKIVSAGAPMRTIKEIKKIEEELID